jgi:hypothetical protein
MNLGRKEALVALIAGVAPWIVRRAEAEPAPVPIRSTPSTDAVHIAELQKRVAAVEALLANQVAFAKDAAGNLTLNAPAAVTIAANTNLSLKAGASGLLSASGPLTLKGSMINQN